MCCLFAITPIGFLCFHRLIQCAMKCTASSPQYESTLLILIQKLLASLPTSQAAQSAFSELFLLVTLSHRASTHSLSYAQLHLNTNKTQRKLASTVPQQRYSSSTLGIILAGQLLLRSRPGIAEHDQQAILNSCARAQSLTHDVTSLFALDMLSTCMWDAMFNVQSDVGLQLSVNVNSSTSSSSSSSLSNPLVQSEQPFITRRAPSTANTKDSMLGPIQSTLQVVMSKLLESFKLTNRFVVLKTITYNLFYV